MEITNIGIDRVIAHEVVRASQFEEHPPVLSDDLLALDVPAKELVGKRLIDSVSSGSHCVDVVVDDSSDGSAFDRASKMFDMGESEFVEASKYLAGLLSSSQTAGPIKSGSVIFIHGSCNYGADSRRFLAIIKADSDTALVKSVRGETISLKFVKDMLLGESQRLIKVAFILEETPREEGNNSRRDAIDFSIRVFDHLMQNSGNGDAAAYFYRTFLKCRLSLNASRQTKIFFEIAKEHVESLAISRAEKMELHNDLVSYLRGNRTTLESRQFAQDVFPRSNQAPFVKKCADAGIGHAITKDLELLKGSLRRQRVKFSSNVTLTASPEVFKSSVEFLGTAGGWTKLKIKGEVESFK